MEFYRNIIIIGIQRLDMRLAKKSGRQTAPHKFLNFISF